MKPVRRKRKEKELTKEQALDLAYKEALPYWYHSEPLFFAAPANEKPALFPIHGDFEKQSWILILVDPTDADFDVAADYAKEYNRRYEDFNIRPVLILSCSLPAFTEKAALKPILEKHKFDFPVVIDHNGLISVSLSEKPGSSVALFYSKKNIHPRPSKNGFWLEGIENQIQIELRKSDPGLPLLPEFKSKIVLQENRFSLDLKKGGNAKFKALKTSDPDFVLTQLPQKEKETVQNTTVFLQGKWEQTDSGLSTVDPSAELRILSNAVGFNIVASCTPKSMDSGRIAFQIDGVPIPDVFSGSDLSYDDQGSSLIEVKSTRLYRVAQSLPHTQREICLRFPMAKFAGVTLNFIRLQL